MDLSNINNEEWHGKHNFLSEGLLMPFYSHTDGNRGQMFCSHISQCIQVKDSEVPEIFTNFENQIGDNCLGYEYINRDVEVIGKIVKNNLNYILIVKDKDKNYYDIIKRNEAENLTEHYGYRNKNEIIDSIEVNDEIDKDGVIFTNYNYDESMNFSYGTNLNAIYLTYKGFTNEDGIAISESAAKKLSSYFVRKESINVNSNDFLLNLYGDKEMYKTFPDVGEDIKNKRLLGRRRIVHKDTVNTLRHPDKILNTDDIYYADGKIVDIDIFYNGNLAELEKQQYNKQVYNYILSLNKFYKEYVEFLKPIVEDDNNEYSDELIYLYNRYLTFSQPNCIYENKNNLFNNYIVEFLIMHEKPLTVGSKITGRYGNKGVISKIIPDDLMPKLKEFDGKEINEKNKLPFNSNVDIILNPLGVINRLNPSQLLESELNYISKHIRSRSYNSFIKTDNLENSLDYIISYILDVNENQGNFYKNKLNDLNYQEKLELFFDFINDGIFIHQPPFWGCININDLENIYDKYNIPYCKFEDIENDMIFGSLYFVRLILAALYSNI